MGAILSNSAAENSNFVDHRSRSGSRASRSRCGPDSLASANFPAMTSPFASVRRILLGLSGVALAGIALAWWLSGTFSGLPDRRTAYSVFFVIFGRGEPMGLAIVILFSFASSLLFFGKREFFGSWLGRLREKLMSANIPSAHMTPKAPASAGKAVPLIIACLVFAVASLGTHFVCHDYSLSSDEFNADFQAEIFLHGKVTAEVPPQWRNAVRVIKPIYVDYLPVTHSWKATYLPVYAGLRALFQAVHLQLFLNPFLAAITVLTLYGTARNIWPNKRQHALLAALLLAVAAQFLLMSMTAYAMPAHLALNTLWLWLYTRPDLRRFYLAPFVGVLAIGLHQPIVHALFVAPFLIRLVLERRWRVVISFGLIYSLGCAVWYTWRLHYLPPSAEAAGSIFRLFNPKMIVIQPIDLLLVIGWSCLTTPLLAVLGFRRIFRRLSATSPVRASFREVRDPHLSLLEQDPPSRQPEIGIQSKQRAILRDAALSCLLTFGFYYFFCLDQGHGWGYRYFHGTLSCLVLVAVNGWEVLVETAGARRARNFVLAGVAVSFLIALPLRCYQAETFIRPFARASEMIHSMNAEVVGIDPRFAWYSNDLIRNNPFLEDRPIIVGLIDLKPQEVAALTQAGNAHFVTREELYTCGLATTEAHRYRRDPFRLGLEE